jgi:hypothetical protein
VDGLEELQSEIGFCKDKQHIGGEEVTLALTSVLSANSPGNLRQLQRIDLGLHSRDEPCMISFYQTEYG